MMITVRTFVLSAVAAACSSTLLLTSPAGAAPRVKPRVVSFTPDSYVRVETVVTKSKERKYYVMSPDKPIEFSLSGPTTVNISTRLLFSVDMKGEQRYTISVTQDTLLGHAQEVAAMTFTASKSPVSILGTGSRLVPGEGKRLKLTVPSGRHAYRIHLSGTSAQEAAVRIMVPRKAIRP
ncbi:MAG: hypothetical protein ACOYXR_13555 [Nitrospirota bacterium]